MRQQLGHILDEQSSKDQSWCDLYLVILAGTYELRPTAAHIEKSNLHEVQENSN